MAGKLFGDLACQQPPLLAAACIHEIREIREIRIRPPGYVTANVVHVTLWRQPSAQGSGVVECLGACMTT